MNDSSKFSYSETQLENAPDRERFELEATTADEHAELEIDLALTWREVVLGVSRVVGWFFTEQRCGLILARNDGPAPVLSAKQLAIVESVLCGTCQKVVGINLNAAPSTIALHARQGLAKLGVTGRPSKVHPLLMQMARAACEHSRAAGSLSIVDSPLGELQVVGIERPDMRLGATPAAELDAARRLFEGQSHAEIARARHTSQRTVANQLAAVFRRFGVSGRNELLNRLFGVRDPEALRAESDLLPPPSRPRMVASLLPAARSPICESRVGTA